MIRKIILVAGARPNFMKIAPLWKELRKYPDDFDPLVVHTGQHYDVNMSDSFFNDLELPEPDISLGVGSGTHAEQTAGVMLAFEKICMEQSPDMVIVVGDVNSTLACAITSAKLNIPVAHVEAGLRSWDRTMPEEINRLVTDSISDLLFTPSKDADENLLKEGHPSKHIHRVGNIMIDSLISFEAKARDAGTCDRLSLIPGSYGLITLHRPSNVDEKDSLSNIINTLTDVAQSFDVVFPVHPRTRKNLEKYGLLEFIAKNKRVKLLDPIGYLDFMNILMNSKFVLTDSGGIQEETTYLGIPCLTLRQNTERPETVTEGTNELVSLENLKTRIIDAYDGKWKTGKIPELWDGKTASRIVNTILNT
jgi:UDP-N-acetylglucosamine 2-epimerase (non-hydrolysing)